MHYALIYDLTRDGGTELFHPGFGLAALIIGLGMRFLWHRPIPFNGFLIIAGVVFLLGAGALPLWDDYRAKAAVRRGEAKMVEGQVSNWRLARSKPNRTGRRFFYSYFEYFSVGGTDFLLKWGNLEAGFNNQGSHNGMPNTRIADGDNARIWYLEPDRLISTPRIVRFELAPAPRFAVSGSAVVPQIPLTGRVMDRASIFAAERKAALEARLATFEQESGHQFVVVTVPTLGGGDIVRFTAALADTWGIGRKGVNDGIVLLMVPSEHKVRIAAGDGLAAVLGDAACERIIAQAILPLARNGDLAGGIEAGATAIMAAAGGRGTS